MGDHTLRREECRVARPLCKAIKPPKLNMDAVRLELLNELRKEARRIVREDLNATVRTWDTEVEFSFSISLRQPGPQVDFFTDNQVWNWVNEGTRPHDIWAGYYTGKSNKRTLAFPSAFSPKTRPGKLASGTGRSGGPTVYTPHVRHPGTKARNFIKAIVKKRQKLFKRAMEKAMVRGAKKSGHYAGRS